MNKTVKLIIVMVLFFVLSAVPILMSRHNNGDFATDTLTVLTYNIDNIKSQKGWLKVAQVIASGRPQVILLQEVHGRSAASFLARKLNMPYFRYFNYSQKKNKSGLVILSKYPFENFHMHKFRVSLTGYGVLAAEIRIKDLTLLVCCLHLDRIPELKRMSGVSGFKALNLFKKEVFNETVRSRSVDELFAWFDGFKADSIIVGGDFNTVPLSKTIRKMNQKLDDALWPTAEYFQGTYREYGYPLKPRIDFIYHSPGLKRHSAEVIKKGPSDHYPVRAVFWVER